jgi:hypothetical protein
LSCWRARSSLTSLVKRRASVLTQHLAADFLQDPRVQGWLDGVEPAWTLLTFESLLALRHEPSAVQSAIQIANELSVDEIASSAVARNTLILLKHASERVGLPLTATGNLSRATVAEMGPALKAAASAAPRLYPGPTRHLRVRVKAPHSKIAQPRIVLYQLVSRSIELSGYNSTARCHLVPLGQT